MFRRKADAPPAEPTAPVKEGGKGRPTPSRKEAEAAARARAKAPKDRKAAAKYLRERRAEENRKMREGIKAGDQRYLPKRDQGPQRAFIRDLVDSRLCFAEFLLPLLLVILFLQYTPNEQMQRFSNGLWSVTIILVLLDTVLLRFTLKRQLKARFPDESHKGATFYAVLRALQVRLLRMPKPRVKLGQPLPARY